MRFAAAAACYGFPVVAQDIFLSPHPAGRAADSVQTYAYQVWSDPIKAGTCTGSISIASTSGVAGTISCVDGGGVKAYGFPAGIFEIDEQLLVPESTSITGAANPNDMDDPTATPSWEAQTLFLATRGATNYTMNYCHAADMVTTRVGFVLSSYVTVRDVSYQGIDTIRPSDNGGLCGGGVFETKGCAENDCAVSDVNNGGSDGLGSVHVTIENIRLNDYHFAEDESKIGASIDGNYNCDTEHFDDQCCFCKPNEVRSSQVGIWVPQSRNDEGTRNLFVNNVVSRSCQADAINLHGNVHDSVVQNAYFENTGDDHYVLWGASSNPSNITFKDSTAVNPGIMRPNWYGNCGATYGLQSVVFENIVCRAPTLEAPIPAPGDGTLRTDTSMFVFFTSFGGHYPPGNSITIKNWIFEDLSGNSYMPETGVIGSQPEVGKMAWTQPSTAGGSAAAAPYYFPTSEQTVNVYVSTVLTYAYDVWSAPIKAGTCTDSISITSTSGTSGTISCATDGGVKAYGFPAGIFEIGEQLLVPESTSITGAADPNNMEDPTATPNWETQTLFLATRGATNYSMNYCHAADMVTTRVGFVLSSYVTVRDVSYQGIDTIRPSDNGGLCGGGAFETKGCAENDCNVSDVNNAGSDGLGSVHVTIENIRLNDYHFAEDESKIGASIDGNYNCDTEHFDDQCCFCKPNEVRSSQVGIWVPQSRNDEGTRNLFVNNVVSRSCQADAINLHGNVHDSLVQNAYFENTGDDHYVLWGASSNPSNITFKDSTAVNPGIMRPNWYGNCGATYGLQSVLFENIVCRAPTLEAPIPAPGDGTLRTDTSMFVFFTSFGGHYPPGNNITIVNWTFEDLSGTPYTPETGVTGSQPEVGKMAWTQPSTGGENAAAAPYYFPTSEQTVNVYIGAAAHSKISLLVLALVAQLL